jgi:Protein of unknown function (DUF1499)
MATYASGDRQHERRQQAVRRLFRPLVVLAIVAAGAAAYFAWPHINAVETGRTKEYPDLKPREYDKSPADVTRAAHAVVARLGWEYFGGGSGAGGSEVRAKVRLWKIPVPGQVVAHVKGKGSHSTLTVRSETEYGPWDFGQNARNIRAFLTEMDVEILPQQ